MLAIDSWTFLLAIWSAMQLFWCLPLLVSHLYYAISNTTTYESIKYGSSYPPRKNPYDRGIIANVNEFLFEGRKWLDAFPADGEILRRERSIELV